jgi:hypothetical protein
VKRHVRKVLRKYNKEFEEIMDENNISTDYKLPIFIIYFVQQIVDKNAKPTEILRDLDEKGAISSYARLAHKINSKELDGDVSAEEFANEFANSLISFIGERKADLDKIKLRNLVFHVVKLIQLTDNAIPFDISAEENLKVNYEKKINTAIGATKAIANIQSLLLDTVPENSSDLIIVINKLIRKMFK